jgi:hypothetical protein
VAAWVSFGGRGGVLHGGCCCQCGVVSIVFMSEFRTSSLGGCQMSLVVRCALSRLVLHVSCVGCIVPNSLLS